MSIFDDLRYAVRQLRHAPGFSIAALTILGLGIGAGTAIFAVVNTVLLKPLPFYEPDRLVAICETNPAVDRFCVASPPNIEDWAASSRSLESIGFARDWSFLMRTDAGASAVRGGFATAGWFRALRVVPQLGRVFEAADIGAESARVAVLSHAVWVERFGRDAGVVGHTIALEGEPFTVIGVLPEDFDPPDLGPVEVWTPPPWDPRDEERRGWRGFGVVARLAPDVTLEQASAELASVQSALAREHPETNEGWGVRIVPLHELITGSTRPTFLVFMGAVSLLLLVACANLANLVLVRATNRRREMAVRAAIGASRAGLVRQQLLESLLLSVTGGVIGFAIAGWATTLIVRLAPAGIPRLDEAGVDLSAFGFSFVLALVTAALFGLVPALWASRVDLARGLREGLGTGRSRGGNRTRRALVIGEVALTLMLLTGAGLLMRSFATLLRWDPGFDRGAVLTFSAFASTERYPDGQAVGSLWQRVEEEIAALPGVTSVATVSAGPVFGGIETDRVQIVGDPPLDEPPAVRWYDAAPAYFSTLGVPILRGRGLSDADVAGSPTVAVVNETFARRSFADRDPIGQRVHLVQYDLELEIVGVVADVPPFYAGQPTEPEIWWSNRQYPRWGTFFVVRGSTDPALLGRAIRQRIDGIDPELQTRTPSTIEELVGRRLVGPRFNLLLVAVLAAVALVLAAAGVYGVLAYAVATRHREIGIRMALGADSTRVLRRIVGDGLTTAAAGLVLGSMGALALAGYLQSLLFGVAARDPSTYAGTLVLLLVVSAAACMVPALRASRIDPAHIMREE